MATTSKKEEQIFIGLDDQVVELTGKDKEVFIAKREADKAELDALELAAKTQRALKISAYTKLGLTEEEINAIL